MNTGNTILRRSAIRLPFLSQAAMATTTLTSNHVIWPLNTFLANNNIEAHIVPIRRYSPSIDRQQLPGRYFSTSMTLKGENNDAEMEGSDDTDMPQSPLSSPLAGMNMNGALQKSKKKKKFIPRKAAVELTEKARTLFQKLLENHPSRDGILLNYNQSSTGEPRMVFSFSFVSQDELDDQDEGVSLEVNEDGNPKSPRDALDDGLPKLYVHHNAFLKVLGAKVDVNTENITPVLYDKEGFELDANL